MPLKLTLCAFGLLFLLARNGHAGALTIDEQTLDFGERYQFAKIEREIRVWNRSGAPIRFLPSSAKSDVRVSHDRDVLAPGESTPLHVSVDLGNRSGSNLIRAEFQTDEAGKREHYQILLNGFVDSILDEPRPAIELGAVTQGDSVERSLRLTSSNNPDLRVTRILQKPDFLSARIGERGSALLVRAVGFKILGIRKAIIKVALSSPLQREAWVTVLADLRGNVIPDQNPVSFDVQRPSNLRPVRLQLTSRNGRSFEVGRIQAADGADVRIDPASCLPTNREGCHAYLLTLNADHPIGAVSGKVTFELPDTHQDLDVYLAGIFLGNDMKVRSLNEPDKSAPAVKSTEGGSGVNLSKALKNITVAHTEPAPLGHGPLLQWNVDNEAGMYGYAIYRGDTAEGPFTRVNPEIVKAGNAGDNTSAAYRWSDASAIPGKEYWYYISIYYNSGKKAQLTGPKKVVAK